MDDLLRMSRAYRAEVQEESAPSPVQHLRARLQHALHKEYDTSYFWWELLPLMMRLTLTGFVLINTSGYPQARVDWRTASRLSIRFSAQPRPTQPRR